MLKGLTELLNLILFYISFHVIAFMVLIGFLVYVMRGIDYPQNTFSPVTILEPFEVCNRFDGCPIVKGICQGCETIQKNRVIFPD